MSDYPSESDLAKLREWPFDDPRGWLAFARELWWQPDWGWPNLEGHIATGGWSGNEDIIAAMQGNYILWAQTWESSHRGGGYIFHLPAKHQPDPETPGGTP